MTKSIEDAMNLMTYGWDEPLAEIKKGVERNFKTNTVANKTRPSTGVVGYAPCVPNAIRGLPNSMIMTERTPTKVKAVTVVFAVSVNGFYSAESIRKAGINVLNIVNNLELAGYRVRLDVEFGASKHNNDICTVRVCVKDWRQPLDLKKLTFPIAHPSMFRRFGFRWLETVPNLKNAGFRGGYGSASFLEDHGAAVKLYKENGILTDNEYLITSYLCFDKDHDETEIMKACGMTAIK